jgi:hypothetical protein
MRALTIYEIIAVILIAIVGLLLPFLTHKYMKPASDDSGSHLQDRSLEELNFLYGGRKRMEALLFLIGFLPPVLVTLYVKIGWWTGLGFGLGILLPSLMHLIFARRAGNVREFFTFLEMKNNVKMTFIVPFYAAFILIGMISGLMLLNIYSVF